jgi:hypothetical protein
MPLLHHTMRGTLGLHRQSVQLAGQSYREVTDVDHFLNLAVTFGAYLAHFK